MQADRPFVTRAFLRSALTSEYEAFRTDGRDEELVARLRAWVGRKDFRESSAEPDLIQKFFVELWSYAHPSGAAQGFTLLPKGAVPKGGVGGFTGEADIALGRFGEAGVSDVPQVIVELKGRGVGLDAPQKGRSDRRTPVQQALGYVAALRRGMIGNEAIRPTWAVVTDMNAFRLYWWERAPSQFIEFRVERTDLLAGVGLLGEDEEAAFDRFLFAWAFRADQLLTTGGPSRLEQMIGRSFVRQREIETAFYAEYRAYREHLYAAIRDANPGFPGTRGRLVRLTQKLLDRAIFVFYCEDMGGRLSFPPQLLRDFLREKARDPYYDPEGGVIWEQMRRMFKAMNEGGSFGHHPLNAFNGGLFAADSELDGLSIPNRVFCAKGQGENEASLHSDRRTLLYLSATYNFAADLGSAAAGVTGPEGAPVTSLGLYTLGRVFEQSITELEILEAEAEGRVSVNKASKRKRDGVYYTPEWVVDRIVGEALGPRLTAIKAECGWPEAGDPDEEAVAAYEARLRRLTILDPACGSGAFLITALRHLQAEWEAFREVRRRVTKRATMRDADALVADILTTNLYGVDINPASVEITQLALWLHTARGDRSLSSLSHHVRAGNSLIDGRFWKGQLDLALYDEEERERVNTFDWEDAFPEVFGEGAPGGFDVIVGNPPYVKLQNFRKAHADMAEYLREGRDGAPDAKGYKSAKTGNFDLFLPFVERGLELLAPGGRMGMIMPSLWVMLENGAGLRGLVEHERALDAWIDFRSFQVFEEATTYTALQFFEKARGEAPIRIASAPEGRVPPDPFAGEHARIGWDGLAYGDRWLMLSGPERALIDRLDRDCQQLGDRAVTSNIFVGLQTSADSIYHLSRVAPGRYHSKASDREVRIEDALMHPLVSGAEARRYEAPRTDTYVLFPYEARDGATALIPADEVAARFPLAWAYLSEHEEALRAREAKKDRAGAVERGADGKAVEAPFDDEDWFRFGRSQNIGIQDQPKLIIATTVTRPEVCYDEAGEMYANNVRVNGIVAADRADHWYLLGVLNGRVCDWVLRRIAKPKANDYYEANRQFIEPLPIPRADADARAEVGRRAERLQSLHTDRRDAAGRLARRLKGTAQRARPWDFLFPHIALPRDRDEADPGRAFDEELATELSRLDDALGPAAELRAVLEADELRVEADGAPILRGVFVAEDGSLIAAQWNAFLAGFEPTRAKPGKRLAVGLRRLLVRPSEAVSRQIVDLQAELDRLDAETAVAEAEMEDHLAELYGLSDAERRLVLAG